MNLVSYFYIFSTYLTRLHSASPWWPTWPPAGPWWPTWLPAGPWWPTWPPAYPWLSTWPVLPWPSTPLISYLTNSRQQDIGFNRWISLYFGIFPWLSVSFKGVGKPLWQCDLLKMIEGVVGSPLNLTLSLIQTIFLSWGLWHLWWAYEVTRHPIGNCHQVADSPNRQLPSVSGFSQIASR